MIHSVTEIQTGAARQKTSLLLYRLRCAIKFITPCDEVAAPKRVK